LRVDHESGKLDAAIVNLGDTLKAKKKGGEKKGRPDH